MLGSGPFQVVKPPGRPGNLRDRLAVESATTQNEVGTLDRGRQVALDYGDSLARPTEAALQPPLATLLAHDVVALGLAPSIDAGDALVQPAQRSDQCRRQEHGHGGRLLGYGRPPGLLLPLRLLFRGIE